jgi:hypothetical protein
VANFHPQTWKTEEDLLLLLLVLVRVFLVVKVMTTYLSMVKRTNLQHPQKEKVGIVVVAEHIHQLTLKCYQRELTLN